MGRMRWLQGLLCVLGLLWISDWLHSFQDAFSLVMPRDGSTVTAAGKRKRMQTASSSLRRSSAIPWGCALALIPCVVRRAVVKPSSKRSELRGLWRVARCVTSGDSLELFSPAKVNLFLRIIRKREDGYHDLASLFHTVAFGDSLKLEVLGDDAEKDSLECNLPGVPVDESNLVIRALKLFREKSGIQRFFSVKLEKQIPAQAGMGGGSSNAAAAFFGANALCGSPASPEDLISWGDDPVIGSDATFFLSEGTAYCTGRGEIVTPIDGLPIKEGLSVFLVKPNYGLSTGKVFKAMDYSKLSTIDPEELLQTFKDKGTSHGSWVNDLEAPAFTVSPELKELKDYLSSCGFEAVLMSGSGSTIFCLGEPSSGADTFQASTKEKFDIEGIWKTRFMRRPSPTEWYQEV